MSDLETPVLASAELRWLHEFWNRRRGARPFLARADFQPEDLKPLLGMLILVDVLPGETPATARFRYRVHGSKLVQQMGYDMTGRTVDEVPNADNARFITGKWRQLVAERRPIAFTRERVLGQGLRRYEALALPLSSDGAAIDMILEGIAFL
jgi:hypothetical protein